MLFRHFLKKNNTPTMMIAPAITSPTAKPIIALFPSPLLDVAAVFGATVASVLVAGVVDDGLSEDVTGDGEAEAVDDEAVVDEDDGDDVDEDDANEDDVMDSLALPSRARYQLVLQNPPPLCSSGVPWALTTLKTNGFVRFGSSLRISHWYHWVARLAGFISRAYENSSTSYSLTSCTEFATLPL